MSRISLFITTFLLCLQPVLTFAAKPVRTAPATAFTTNYRQFDANRIRNWFSNIGEITTSSVTGSSGLEWPAETGLTAVFQSGLWIAGKVDGEIRTAAAEYASEFQPGKIIYDSVTATEAGVADDPYLAKYKIYTINRGDQTSDDYLNWPVADGAPVDAEGKPLLLGDQTHWFVCNDLNAMTHSSLWVTNPLGLEVQITLWGYNTTELQDVMFVKWLIINKSGKTIQDVYFSVWGDPDIGDAHDDYVGCDTILNLGYSYNGDSLDTDYGCFPPSVGFNYLQRPVIASVGDSAFISGKWLTDYKNLPITSFVKYTNSDEQYSDPETAQETYNYMKGLTAQGSNWLDLTGKIINFLYPGDPISQSGYTEFDDDTPGDRRFLLNSGPIEMPSWQDIDLNGLPDVGEPGVQELACAIVIGQGNDYLSSITAMKELSRTATAFYEYGDNLPKISIIEPIPDTTYSGNLPIRWAYESSLNANYVVIQLSLDGGNNWINVETVNNNQTEYSLNLTDISDSFLGKVRLIGYVSEKQFSSSQTPGYFKIDNPNINADPVFVSVKQSDQYELSLTGNAEIRWFVRDPDDTALDVTLEMRNHNQDWFTVASELPDSCTYNLATYNYPNSTDCYLRLKATDSFGNSAICEIPHHFTLYNERKSLLPLYHRSGSAVPPVIDVAIVDSSIINNHLYELRFYDGDTMKYSIFDIDRNAYLFQNLTIIDEMNESPFFDGLAVSIRNVKRVTPWDKNSGWIQGNSDWNYSMYDFGYVPKFLSNYEIRFTDNGSDDVRNRHAPFEVWNLKFNRLTPFSLSAQESDGIELIIADTTSLGKFQALFDIRIYSTSSDSVPPVTGDIFYVFIATPLTSEDVYRFTTDPNSINDDPVQLKEFSLHPIFPNPFNPITTIRYQLPEQTLVEITAYNLLGQQVKRLVKEQKSAGTYSVIWNAENLPSGIYLIRMTAGNFYKVQKCVLLK